jgi:hypothetical protein
MMPHAQKNPVNDFFEFEVATISPYSTDIVPDM